MFSWWTNTFRSEQNVKRYVFSRCCTFEVQGPGPEVIKLLSCVSQLSIKFVLLTDLKLLTTANSFLLNIAEHDFFFFFFFLLTDMKMPTIVGIFRFVSREMFMLSWAEPEKSFITSGLDLQSFHKIKVANGATVDITKITKASLLFQSTFPDCCFDNCLVRKIN